MKLSTLYKNIISFFTLIVFFIFAISSTDDSSNSTSENSDSAASEESNEYEGETSDLIDYTEDNNQFAKGWTIYHTNKPNISTSDCNSRTCEWCGESYYAEKIKFTEIPDTDNPLQMMNIVENNNGSTGGIGSYMGELSIDDDLIDYDNKTITTDWEYSCQFDDLNFCSRRCASEYH
jgi:hypothetical protein